MKNNVLDQGWKLLHEIEELGFDISKVSLVMFASFLPRGDEGPKFLRVLADVKKFLSQQKTSV